MKKNKKAMGITDVGMLVYRVIFLTLTAFVIVMFMNLLLAPPNFPREAKIEMLFGRVFYSEAIHHETSDRVYTNIIDVDKLQEMQSDNNLESYFRNQFYHPTRSNLLVFNLTVRFSGDDYTFISNSTQYKLLDPKESFMGKGAITAAQRKFTTNCLVQNEIIPCETELTVLMPNS